MRRSLWAVGCVAVGVVVAVGWWGAFRALQFGHLPLVAEMTAACPAAGSAAAPTVDGLVVTPESCARYFDQLDQFRRLGVSQGVISGAVVAYLLLVWRFRRRPLPRPS
jgi:hypothetical protein